VDFVNQMFCKKPKKHKGVIKRLTTLFEKMFAYASAARHVLNVNGYQTFLEMLYETKIYKVIIISSQMLIH